MILGWWMLPTAITVAAFVLVWLWNADAPLLLLFGLLTGAGNDVFSLKTALTVSFAAWLVYFIIF